MGVSPSCEDDVPILVAHDDIAFGEDDVVVGVADGPNAHEGMGESRHHMAFAREVIGEVGDAVFGGGA